MTRPVRHKKIKKIVAVLHKRSNPVTMNPASLFPFLKNKTLSYLLISSLTVCTLQAESTNRKGPPIQSPDGLYEAVLCTTPEYEYHFLIYPSGNKGKSVETPNWGRGIDILWSPDHTKFAINHYGGSDFAKPILYELSEKGKLKNLAPHDEKKSDNKDEEGLSSLFWKQFSQNYNLPGISFGQYYVYARGWLD